MTAKQEDESLPTHAPEATPALVAAGQQHSSSPPVTIDFSPLDPRFCPWCGYDVADVQGPSPCPECGLDIGTASRHRALIRRSSTDARSRMILLVSPVIAVVLAIPSYASGGMVWLATCLVGVVSIAGMLAIWRLGRTPGANLPFLVILIGGPFLGILYFLVLLLFAASAIVPIAILARVSENTLSPLLMVAIILVVCIVGAILTMLALRWAIGLLTPRRKRTPD
jgi:hypothetical protein